MIFISTGGFKSEKSINSINKLMEKGIYDIELSGGEYEVDQIEKIITEKYELVSRSFGLIRPLRSNTYIISLFFGQFCEFRAYFFQMKSCNLFI